MDSHEDPQWHSLNPSFSPLLVLCTITQALLFTPAVFSCSEQLRHVSSSSYARSLYSSPHSHWKRAVCHNFFSCVCCDCLKTPTHHYKSLSSISQQCRKLKRLPQPEVLPAFTSFTVKAVLTPHMHFSNLWILAVYPLNNLRETAKMYINA